MSCLHLCFLGSHQLKIIFGKKKSVCGDLRFCNFIFIGNVNFWTGLGLFWYLKMK